MKKLFLLTFACLVIVLSSFAQPTQLDVKVGARGLFLEHKVLAKENFYSLGREYTVHPKHLAAFNGLDMSKGLSLGQVVNIPLSDSNLVRNTAEGIPVCYQSNIKQTVGTVSAISRTSGENLRQMNHFSGDNIAPATKVIIGYLITATEDNLVSNESVETKPIVEEKKSQSVDVTATNTEPKTSPPPKTSTSEEPVKPVIKQDNKGIAKKENKLLVKEESKVETPSVSNQQNHVGDGYFKTVFIQQVKAYPLSKETTVSTGIFKTTSGWNDGKYYALIDGIESGIIIKVTNPNNNKEIFAKVLGPMSGIRQNQGLNLRISNAAAAALEIPEQDKFIVKVNY